MTGVLLFCITEEAKPFVRKALDIKNEIASPPVRLLYLVQSRICPKDHEGFKTELKDDETFETDFIGGSAQDCQQWALEKQFQVNFIDQDLIAIADARSARDDTLLLQYYSRELEEPLEFWEFGVLPREHTTWYDFRIDYRGAASAVLHLTNYGPLDTIYPTYFGRKEGLTDERGVFNVAEALRFVRGDVP